MMSVEELLAVFTAVGASAAEARGQVEEATSTARSLTEEAAAHGWEGVAATTESVAVTLETVLAALASYDVTAQGAGSLLQGISGDVSRRDILERLEGSVPELDKSVDVLVGAVTGTDQAIAGAETAGEPADLLVMLHALRDTLSGALGRSHECRQKVEAEVTTAGGWGN